MRSVPHTERRVKECEKLGMRRVTTNENIKTLKHENINVIGVKNIVELIRNT